MKLYVRIISSILRMGVLALLLSGCAPLSPSFEPLATPSAAVEEITLTAVAEEAVIESAEAAAPRAEVLAPTLNMRGGPGTNYPILATTKAGEQFEVVGQVNACRWLLVSTDNGQAWISGGAQFTRLDGECSAVAEAPIPTAPAPPPPATAVPAPEAPATPQATAPATEETTAPPPTDPAADEPAAAEDALPAGEGCYLFQNQLGPEITITLTRRDDGWTDTFKLQPNEERPYCLVPGFYDYTLDAPPPYGALNDTIEVQAGDRFYFPIRPKE